jgi:hypothetical protein
VPPLEQGPAPLAEDEGRRSAGLQACNEQAPCRATPRNASSAARLLMVLLASLPMARRRRLSLGVGVGPFRPSHTDVVSLTCPPWKDTFNR